MEPFDVDSSDEIKEVVRGLQLNEEATGIYCIQYVVVSRMGENIHGSRDCHEFSSHEECRKKGESEWWASACIWSRFMVHEQSVSQNWSRGLVNDRRRGLSIIGYLRGRVWYCTVLPLVVVGGA